MEKTFRFKNGVIKIGYNEKAGLKTGRETYIKKRIERKTTGSSRESTLCVEAMAHRGGRMCYGLLFVRLRPLEEMNVVKVTVAVNEENMLKYEDAMLSDTEQVFRGFPKEYLELTLESIINSVNEKEVFPQCEIAFECAANGEVSSSAMFFSYLAELIIGMIANGKMKEMLHMEQEKFVETYVKGKKIGTMLC